jgi:TetR/AcrR family transcriptional regulator, transcriptional repressor for nem operon
MKQGYEKTSIMNLVFHTGFTREACMTPLAINNPIMLKHLKRYSEMLEESVKRRMAVTSSERKQSNCCLKMEIQQREEFPEGDAAVKFGAKYNSESLGCVHLNTALYTVNL